MSLEIAKIFDSSLNMWMVNLIGELDITSSENLKVELFKMLDENDTSIELECSDLTYVDSTGLGIFISVLRRTKSANNTIIISNAQPNILKLLDITGLDKIFTIKK